MNPETLKLIGVTLYGSIDQENPAERDWITPLAADLGIARRTMERWRAGKMQIPPRIHDELYILMEDRANLIDSTLDKLDEPD